jgi:hypothetical protein
MQKVTAARDSQHEKSADADNVNPTQPPSRPQRHITVFDAVAGRGGLNGFLREDQLEANVLPVAPEQILTGRSRVPQDLVQQYAEVTPLELPHLPDSDMLKAIHTYAADFYTAATDDQGQFDFTSMDETALIAMGILLEEAVQEALGENGDMVFVEPEGLGHSLDESNLIKYQVRGRVRPVQHAQMASDEDSLKEDESPAKKQRR